MRVGNGLVLWRVTGLIAFLSFLLLATGFVLSLQPHVLAPNKPIMPAPQSNLAGNTLPTEGKLLIVSLGDSLTRGTGDANGQGYIGLVRQAIEKKNGQQVILSNLAINGLQSPKLVEQLGQRQVKQLVSQANLIVFTIGGNDLFQQSGDIYEIDKKKLATAESTLASNFETIIKNIRHENGKADILYVSLYNPFGDTTAAAETSPYVLKWNAQAAEIASRYPNVFVVPTFDLFYKKEKAYLYTDHFHPNSDGYERIAQRVMQALR